MLERYTGFSQVCGVGVQVSPEGTAALSLCLVETKGQTLEIVKKVGGLISLKELLKHVPTSVPLALNLAGKGVLTRQLTTAEASGEDVFSKVLPGSDPGDFVLQTFEQGETSFVSLLRSSEAQRYLDELSALGYQVLLLSLGPFAASQVLSQVNLYGPELAFDGHRVSRNERGHWTVYRYESSARAEFPLKIESEPLAQELLLAYASAFQLALSTRLPLVQAGVPRLQAALASAMRNLKIRVFSYAALGLLFLLLLVNFLYFSHLEQQNRELARNTSRSAQSSLDLTKLTAEIQGNRSLLDSLGWDGGASKAAMADQVSQLKPAEISLDELAINPVAQLPGGSQKTVRFAGGLIRISGTSAKITELGEWVERVRSLPWVRAARLQRYSYQAEKNTGQFTLEITYGSDPK